MRQLLTLVFSLFLLGFVSAQISTFPYNEDFEGENQGSTSCTTPYAMQTTGWSNAPGNGTDWRADVGGTSSSSTGPSGPGGTTSGGTDHNPGTTTGKYLYLETSGCTNRTAILLTPIFDFSSAAAPQLDFWYHMFGATMGSLFFEVTTNGGTTWTTLWSETGDQGNQWLQANVNIAAYGGLNNVQFRFRGQTGTSFTSDMAIDDISIINVQPDNAGISALVNPVQGGAAGLQNVEFTINNYGSNAINSVTVEYEINGVLQPSFLYTGPSIAAFGNANAVVGSFNFPSGTSNVKAWTSLPNNTPDTDNGNDTLNTFFCTGLSGTFTVGTPTSDFPTISDVLTQLYSCGVNGPVIFQIAPGTYNDFINFNGQIPGASAFNTITFDGGSASTTILQHDGTGANGNAVVSFDNASFITIQNLTLRNSGTTDAWGVLFTNNSSRNIVRSNVIEMYYAPLVFDVIGVVASASYTDDFTEGNNSNYNTVEGNTITGGEMGIHFEGANAGRNVGNRILNNTIYGVDDYGMYIDDQDSIDIIGNTIYDLLQTFADGIYVFDIMDFEIIGNNVNASDYGIYIADGNFDAVPTRRGKIINNMVSCSGIYGIYLDGFEESDVFHNTVYNRSTSATSSAIYINDQQDVSILNNIFTSDNRYVFRYIDAAAFNDMDHNLYHRFNTGSNYIQYGANNYGSVADWQTNTFGFGTNSVEGDPIFFSPTDLHVDGPLANDSGDNTAGITVDIDGETRPFSGSTTVDIGADEYKPKDNDAGVIAMTAPIAPLASGFQPVTVTVRNFGLQPLTIFTVEWTYNGVLQSTFTYTGSPIAPQTNVDVTLGSINFFPGTNADFVFWTTLPNGQQDERTSNDTLSISLCPGLNGTYTLGGTNSDFPTFNEAISTLYQCGVSGPVTFSIEPGIYNGQQLALTGNIPGASSINTVTFDGVSPSQVTLTHDGTGTLQFATILLNEVQFVTIQNMTINTTAPAAARGHAIHLINQADNNSIVGNNINMTWSAGITDLIGIVVSNSLADDFSEGNNANNLLIQGNTITGGEMGMHIEGATAQQIRNIRIIDNVIEAYDDYGLYADEIDSLIIIGNTIRSLTGSTVATGLYLFDAVYYQIERNLIHSRDWGIYMSSTNNPSFGARARMVNNMVTSETDDAFYATSCGSVDIWNNTFASRPSVTSGANGAYLLSPVSGTIDLRNNIFYTNSSSTSAYAFQVSVNTAQLALDNNVYLKGSTTNVIRYGTTNYTFANWQTSNPYGYDQNSLSVNPLFVDIANGDLHIQNAALNAAGDSTVTVSDDIDLETRPSLGSTRPDIGADEIILVNNDAIAIGVDAPTNNGCENVAQVVDVVIGNNGLADITSVNVTVNVTGPVTTSLTGSFSGTLTTGQNTTINVGTINTSGGGQFCFEIIAQLVGDANTTNDTILVCQNIVPAVPVFSVTNACLNQSGSITTTPQGGITWYDVPSGGVALSTSDTFITGPIVFPSTFYAEVSACGTTRYPVTVNVITPSPINIGNDTTICSTGNAVLSAPAGVTDYIWSNGETTQAIIVSTAGTYSVTVSDANGCRVSDALDVLNFPAVSLSAVTNTLVCGNDGTGTVDLTVTGSTSPFTFVWNNGSTTEDLNGVNSGSYTVNVLDNNGCEYVDSYVVNGPAEIIFNSFASSSASCGALADGVIDVEVSGGQAPYTFLWNDGSTSEDLSDVANGTYSLTVTDASGCQASNSATLNFVSTVVISIDNVQDEAVQLGGSIDISASGGQAPYYYLWNNGLTSASVSGLNAGTYTVTVTDVNGCSSVETIVVNYAIPALVTDIDEVISLNIFPNPTSNLINFQLSLNEQIDVKLDIYTITGQLIQSLTTQNTLNQHYRIDLTNYPAGVYMSRLIIGNEVITSKIVLKK